MSCQPQQIVNTYSSRKEAEYGVKALVSMGGVKQETVFVSPAEDSSDQFHVCVTGSEQAVKNARAFLQGSSQSPQEDEPYRSPYGLKRARDLMAMDDFG
jgi:hypothetical protein